MAGGNLLKGVGAALAPFSGVLTALAAVWIADKTWDELKDKVLDPIVDVLQKPLLEKYAGDYSMIVAWLRAQYATSGWDFLDQDYSSHEAFINTSEGVSALWRGKYDESFAVKKLGPYVGSSEWASANYVKGYGYQMPSWLVDRFDMFVYTMKQTTAGNKEAKPPTEWWVQFYTYAEFENEIIWYAKNR